MNTISRTAIFLSNFARTVNASAISLYAGIMMIAVVFLWSSCAQGQMYKTLSVREVSQMLNLGTALNPTSNNATLDTTKAPLVLDVRTEAEFSGEMGHIKGAMLIPVQALEERLGELAVHKSRTILVYCRSGARSARASEILAQHGFTVINMAGGMLEWQAARLPVETSARNNETRK